MPKYLYRCTECGVEEMLYHSMNDRIDDCAKCGHSDTMMKIPTKSNLANKALPNQTLRQRAQQAF